MTTCCNKPNGGKGTCWFGGSCDIYCDTDAHCLGAGYHPTCVNGKCKTNGHPFDTSSNRGSTDVNSENQSEQVSTSPHDQDVHI
jgi:hypothetical protein